jgi:hypothetical protein
MDRTRKEPKSDQEQEEEPFTREDFLRDLRKVTKRLTPPDPTPAREKPPARSGSKRR